MKKALLIASVLFIAVISTACINNIAVQELNNKAAEYMEKGDYEAAMNRLEASIDLDATMFETYYNIWGAKMNQIRLEKMKTYIERKNVVTIKQLQELFPDVSLMTIHRDLDALMEAGAVVKFRGGAKSVRHSGDP